MWDIHNVDDLVVCLCDIDEHIGRHNDGFYGVHAPYAVCQRNLEGRIVL